MEHRDRLRSMDPVIKETSPTTTTVEEPEETAEATKHESNQLMPMEAFETMARRPS